VLCYLLLAICSLVLLYLTQGENIPQAQTMTLDEKLAIGCKAAELRKAGDEEGYSRLIKSIPMPPYLAKVYKEKVGVEPLKNGGWNLSEAEAEFGADWLNK
jgi:hypothetical protein